jgi:predicted Co/Zn/Cd cation transporter (cation efflux family)
MNFVLRILVWVFCTLAILGTLGWVGCALYVLINIRQPVMNGSNALTVLCAATGSVITVAIALATWWLQRQRD